ncbi:MAG: hypothetical protein ACU0GG_01400 [Paracoccaceae bacterium]
MSDGYRNGAFALGLITGIGLTVNLLLWLGHAARQQAEKTREAEDNANRGEMFPEWGGLIGTFVSPSDTLAQWIMAVFTVTATLVLLFTLRTANRTNKAAVEAAKAANESNAIMRAERRPWLKIEIEEAQALYVGNAEITLNFNVLITNVGKTPASNVAIVPFGASEYVPIPATNIAVRASDTTEHGTNLIVFPDQSVTEKLIYRFVYQDHPMSTDSAMGERYVWPRVGACVSYKGDVMTDFAATFCLYSVADTAQVDGIVVPKRGGARYTIPGQTVAFKALPAPKGAS